MSSYNCFHYLPQTKFGTRSTGGRGLPPGGGSALEGLPKGGGGVGKTPQWDTMGYGQQAGGTHHTGMHSCSLKIILLFSDRIFPD